MKLFVVAFLIASGYAGASAPAPAQASLPRSGSEKALKEEDSFWERLLQKTDMSVAPSPTPIPPTEAPPTGFPPIDPTVAPATPTMMPPTDAPPTASPPLPTIAPANPPTAAPVNPTAAPVTPTTAPVDPTPSPVDTTAAPIDATPSPVDATPSPVDATPAPIDATPSPVAPFPAPIDATPSPVDITPSPVESTPSPVDPTPSSSAPTVSEATEECDIDLEVICVVPDGRNCEEAIVISPDPQEIAFNYTLTNVGTVTAFPQTVSTNFTFKGMRFFGEVTLMGIELAPQEEFLFNFAGFGNITVDEPGLSALLESLALALNDEGSECSDFEEETFEFGDGESTPAPIDATPAPVEPTTSPVASTPAPVEPVTPSPVASTPAPVDSTPAPAPTGGSDSCPDGTGCDICPDGTIVDDSRVITITIPSTGWSETATCGEFFGVGCTLIEPDVCSEYQQATAACCLQDPDPAPPAPPTEGTCSEPLGCDICPDGVVVEDSKVVTATLPDGRVETATCGEWFLFGCTFIEPDVCGAYQAAAAECCVARRNLRTTM